MATTTIPIEKHPDVRDPAARIVWRGGETDTRGRHLPAVYSLSRGYLLTWRDPVRAGQPWSGSAALDLYGSESEATSAWQVLKEEAYP